MEHYILAKFKADVREKESLLPRIREIFAAATDIPGVYSADVYPCCVARSNRYDVMIVIHMEPAALDAYDVSAMHHRWKDEFTPLLESKAIFDHL